MSDIVVIQGSTEYLYADVTSSITLDAQPVEIAYAPTVDDVTSWTAAAWQGAAGTERTARALFTFDALGSFHIFVRITDNPEIPILDAGNLKVKPFTK